MVVFSVAVVFLTLPASWIALVEGGNSCGTDQNPSCKGNSAFESLCCPSPNVCYWQNNGQPGCCPNGESCNGNSPWTTPTTTCTTTPTTTWSTTTSCMTTTPTTTWNNCNECATTVTSQVVPVYTTVTQNAAQAYTTVNGVIYVNAGPKSEFSTILTAMMAGLSALICNIFGV
ncbi:hypothetical protein PV11_02584 [Exophiala sideris]|uniref:Uncharacterized protein n=1 Tax=Exophiala sideris TaxID=1016849 RepID=A0A0D1XG12_9EURO|nr:hypothetical protein PV11_02584 [Exophiala sideris]